MVLKIIFKTLPILLEPFFGKPEAQSFFERLRKIALHGMQIGTDNRPEKSGELFTIRYIKRKLSSKDRPVIMDVGANKGEYSNLILKEFNNQCQLLSFEPAKETFEILIKKLDGTSAISYPIGFGSKAGTVPLYSNPEISALSSLYNRNIEHFNLKLTDKQIVQIETIEDFCLKHDYDQIDFLKLDVEGHELEVLKGSENMLKNGKIHFIQFEFGGCNIDSRTYFADFFRLLSPQYNIYRILKDGFYPIITYSELLECFSYTNFLAERKSLN